MGNRQCECRTLAKPDPIRTAADQLHDISASLLETCVHEDDRTKRLTLWKIIAAVGQAGDVLEAL